MPLDFVLLASTDLTDESQIVYIYKAKHIKSQIYRYISFITWQFATVSLRHYPKEKSTVVFVINILGYTHKNGNLDKWCFIKLYFPFI